jgi:hypothetical protein
VREYQVRGLEHYAEGRLAEAIAIWKKAEALRPGDRRTQAYLERARELQSYDTPAE